ncbi:MAG TPA: YggS family pyridoxal phosphate-dependent enzyme [Candidatus Dormibacteraeota bacterium]|nr:YggS family pyridoxal phosphate-dependent enzyme [Candidatus Dormibacteraeota bacterium]
MTEDLAQRLQSVRTRIGAASERSGRDPGAVRLIAVTKTVEVSRIAAAVELGLRDLGENRVQEAASKAQQLPAGLRWHLIGHLQTNKAARAVQVFDTLHSVDSERVAEALSQRRADGVPLEVLIEVELTGIAAHTGAPEGEVERLARSVAAMPHLRLRGLMTMAPPVTDPADARSTFARLRAVRDDVQQRIGQDLPELSMGMSNDFEVAVEEGATMLRLGRVLFGDRPQR